MHTCELIQSYRLLAPSVDVDGDNDLLDSDFADRREEVSDNRQGNTGILDRSCKEVMMLSRESNQYCRLFLYFYYLTIFNFSSLHKNIILRSVVSEFIRHTFIQP